MIRAKISKGYVMPELHKPYTNWAIQQVVDLVFLTRLASALSDKKLSAPTFYTFEHCTPGGRGFSLLVDNYQIQVTRTGVMHYPNWWAKLRRHGEWEFVPNELERYEVFVTENIHPMHMASAAFPSDKYEFNIIFANATMATERGIYFTGVPDARPDHMLKDRNSHLFEPAKQLFTIFEKQFANADITKAENTKTYQLARPRGLVGVYKRREYLLERIEQKLSKQK